MLVFWYAFRTWSWPVLPAVLYVWVNCFGIIAPVQAWTSPTRSSIPGRPNGCSASIGSGASLGAILGGFLARVLVGLVGGPVNLLLVLAALILASAGIISFANMRLRRPGSGRATPGTARARPFSETLAEIGRTPYLRLIALTVFLVAISTQWSTFQLNVVADQRFGGNAQALTKFFGTFNFALGIVSFIVQLTLTGTALRRFGVAFTIMLLPMALGVGAVSILLFPIFWTVLMTNATDQGLRFSVDKATYELLYLPIPQASRSRIKNAIDIVLNRMGDGVGAIMLGLATRGFGGLPGLQLRRARHRRDQPLLPCRLVRRGLARARRIRPHDSATPSTVTVSTPSGPQRTTLDRSAVEALTSSSTPRTPTA